MESTHATDRSFHFGVFDVNLQSEELRRQGLKIRLPHQSFQVLACLLNRPGQVVTRDELRRSLWAGDTFVDFDMGLSSAVKKLRDALGDSAETPRFIETIPRRGYRFIYPVNGSAAPLDRPSAREVAVRQPPRLGRAAATSIVIFAVAGLSLQIFDQVRSRYREPAAMPSIRSIAVLPLENLTGDPAQEYFVDGMTDALITELAQISDIRVISRTSVIPYKAARKPVPAVARELNVDAIVEGTVVRSGERVRITAQLIDVRSERHLFARNYTRQIDDIVALQAEVAQAIAEAIVGKLTPQQQARLSAPRQVSAEASALFFKAAVAAGGEGYQGIGEAIAYAERAVAKQPDFARAYAAMSLWHVQFSFVGPLWPQEFMPKAEAAARKALQLDEAMAEAHAVLGIILSRFHWDWAAAEKHFRRALDLNPSYADGHRMFAAFLSASGRSTEAIAEAQRAQELDPLSTQTIINVGIALAGSGRHDEAIREFHKALAKAPGLPRAHLQLGAARVAKGDLSAGREELETAVRLSGGNPRFRAHVGYADAVAGKTSDARAIANELEALSREQYVPSVGVAAIHEALGHRETALAWLERAYRTRDVELTGLITDHRLTPLRSDARFQDLVRRVGLTP